MSEQKFVLHCESLSDGFLVFRISDKAIETNIRGLVEKSKAKYSGYFTVKLNMPYKPRTTGEGSQNNLFWAICTEIANYCGDDSAGMRDTEQAIKEKALAKGYPSKVSNITGRPVPLSMTQINTEQMALLIETAQQIAAELGIQLREV